MFCCCCSVLSLAYVFAAFELTAYQTTAMWDCEWLAYHDITFIAVHWLRVFHAHIDWIRSTFNQITPISFAPVHWPLSPRCPPTSDSWRRPWWLAIAPSAVDCVWLSTGVSISKVWLALNPRKARAEFYFTAKSSYQSCTMSQRWARSAQVGNKLYCRPAISARVPCWLY